MTDKKKINEGLVVTDIPKKPERGYTPPPPPKKPVPEKKG